jgi:hypothetical protein
VCVVLRERTHATFFEQFKRTGSATFSLPHPTATSTLADHPFVSHTNVRITGVRPWLLGVKSSNSLCTVHVQHTGPEQMALKGGDIQLLTHGPVNFRFKYDWTTVMWNFAKHYVENPGAALIHDGMDGRLRLDDALAKSSYLPLVGPFTEGKITLLEGDHSGLDLSGASAVCVEFHGLSQSSF